MSAFDGVRAVFFDVDDTLYDFARSMKHAFEHLHATFPDLFAQHKVDQVEEAYWRHYHGVPEARKVELINTDPDLFRRTMWAGALTNLGLQGELDPLARKVTDEMQRLRPRHWRMSMYDGAADLLADLRSRYILGAITNGPSPVQRPKLEALRYQEYFPERLVFVSGEFGARKPDPSIFLAAAKAAGVEPRECLMVGDAREFDMPAKAVGFRTVLFLGPRARPDLSGDEWQPDAVVESYAELRRLLL
ncbi:MAG TPA: HAD family hydrolase [Candidatus Thermoplasmatota archaeon]|nr:HAD family hydrolase [Candidatus Thermoplasmatota archaeon]